MVFPIMMQKRWFLQTVKIVFTSTRTGDLELWTMDIDGKNLKQLTFGLGYDGGAFSLMILKNCIPCFSTKTDAEKSKNTKIIWLKNLVALPIWKSTPSMLMEQI